MGDLGGMAEGAQHTRRGRVPREKASGGVSGSLALRTGLQMLSNNLVGGVLAATTAAPDGQLALHFE